MGAAPGFGEDGDGKGWEEGDHGGGVVGGVVEGAEGRPGRE